MKLYIVLVLSCFSFAIDASDTTNRQDIQLRIQPVGKVFVQNQIENTEKSESGTKIADSVSKQAPGQVTYERFCIVCHRDGLAGAPRFRAESDWKPRLAGRGLDDLLASSVKGLNAMPAKGTCSECTDADLKAAINYMLPES